jgi:monoamine oxidase
MAGLAAAQTLTAAGFSVQVLEGRDRIGGRTWTSEYWSDAPLDMGASWIHGRTNNPMSALADKFATKLVPTDEDNLILYGPDGKVIPDVKVAWIEARCESIK